MDKTSKILLRKQREQPQQHKLANPPILQENLLQEEDYDKWKAINMQYQALFRKKDEITFENIKNPPEPLQQVPLSKPMRTPDNKLDQKYLSNKLQELELKQKQKIKKPALLIQSTEEMLRQLPKGESLLEEAEVIVSKKIKENNDAEELLRDTVDNLHLKSVQKMENEFIEVYNDLSKDIEDIQLKNLEIEQKIRKFSIQANSEKEEYEEIKKLSEKIKDLEINKETIIKEINIMEETIQIINKDISEAANHFAGQEVRLSQEIELYKDKVNKIDNQKVEALEYECKELTRETEELEKDIQKIEKLWKGDLGDVKKIMEEFDETTNALKKELRDTKVSRSVIARERDSISKKIKEVDENRVKYLKSSEEPVQKNPRNLYIYLDNVLTETSRKIRLVLQEKFSEKQTENVVKHQLENLFSSTDAQDSFIPVLKLQRDTLMYLKDKNDAEADYLEKNTISSIPEILKNYQDLESKDLYKSLGSIKSLSTIRKVSPARESSLSSLSKLRDITDKVIRPKHNRTPSRSSKGSIDLTEIEERKIEYERYKKQQKYK
jgi:hypothetical protein